MFKTFPIVLTIFNYIRSFFILFVCLWIGNFISSLLPVTIPGSIIGLLLLFFLLSFQLLPSEWVRCGCGFFMRYMMVLFIPAAKGIMDNYIYLINDWAPILIGSIASTAIVMVFTGWLAQHLHTNASSKDQQTQEGE